MKKLKERKLLSRSDFDTNAQYLSYLEVVLAEEKIRLEKSGHNAGSLRSDKVRQTVTIFLMSCIATCAIWTVYMEYIR